jgi:hypothetical protein
MFVAEVTDTITKESYGHWAVRYDNNPGADYNAFRDGDLDDSDVMMVAAFTRMVTTWENY